MSRARTGVTLTLALGVAMAVVGGPSLVTAQSSVPGPSPDASTPSTAPASPVTSPVPEALPPAPIAWTRNTKGKGFDKGPFLTDIAQGADGTVVMVGAVRDSGGRVTAAAWRTTDGEAWQRVAWETTKPSLASGIVATPAGFLAVGGGVWTSIDGADWTHQAVPDASFRDVAVTADGLVAVGQPVPGAHGVPTLWTAPAATMTDATTWQQQPLAASGLPAAVAVAPDGTIVAAGLVYDDPSNPVPAIWTVRDGVAATSSLDGLATVPSAVMDLRWTPVGFMVAVLQNDGGTQVTSVWTSLDGASWTRSLDVRKGAITALGTIGAEALAFGANRMWQTGDGITWDEVPVKAFKKYAVSADMELADGRLLAAATMYTGPNTSKAATFLGQVVLPPITWTGDPGSQDFGTNPGAADATGSSAIAGVIVGHVTDASNVPQAAAWSSQDAATWMAATIDAPARSFASSVMPWGSGLLSVGFSLDGSGLVWSSPDGGAWTLTTLPGTTLHDVQANGSSLVVLGSVGSTGAPTVWTGTDGDPATWHATSIATAGTPQRLAISPTGVHVAVGVVFDTAGVARLTLWHSPDGVAWTAQQLEGLPPSAVASALEWTPAGFLLSVAGYRKNAPVGSVWQSTDGLVWQQTLNVSHGTVTALGTLGSIVIAFSTDDVWQSANGLIWQKSADPAFHGYSIPAVASLADGQLLAVGQQSTGGSATQMATWTGIGQSPVRP